MGCAGTGGCAARAVERSHVQGVTNLHGSQFRFRFVAVLMGLPIMWYDVHHLEMSQTQRLQTITRGEWRLLGCYAVSLF
jgi:hypothetical protein